MQGACDRVTCRVRAVPSRAPPCPALRNVNIYSRSIGVVYSRANQTRLCRRWVSGRLGASVDRRVVEPFVRAAAVCGYSNEPAGDRARPFYSHGTGGRTGGAGGAGAVKGTVVAGGGDRPVFPLQTGGRPAIASSRGKL